MRNYLYFTVFVSGMTTLAAEFGASRLLGNAFGTSNIVWAVIIGLILMYLTAGYFIGGKWADRSPYARTLYTILAWGAFTLGVVPFIASPVLRLAANAFDALEIGVLAGAFVAVLVLFSVPVTLLGMASPFAIRIALEDKTRVGNVAGTIYGVSTIGSFLGSFLPTLVLIPLIGTTRTFLIFSGGLLLVALGGLWLAERKISSNFVWMVVGLLLLAVLGQTSIKNTPGQIYETESAYNYIQVLEFDGGRYLRLNEGQGIHSEYHPDTLSYGGPWQQFLSAPFFYPERNPHDVTRIAIIGLAAGTTARQAAAVFPNVVMDGWEIDPKIVEVGRRYFDMNLPNLNVYVQDGRLGLERSPYQYDLIVVDAYRPPYIPPHLTTQEFFTIAANHLKPDGVLAINVGRTPTDRRLIDGLATTISTRFSSLYVMDIPQTFNSILYATLQPTSLQDFLANLARLEQAEDVHPLLLESMYLTAAHLASPPKQTIVFTDDRSPIEWLTNDLILDYLLSGSSHE
ncbi:MAG: fused MFS/spermidine synthase [Anaerolineales bacterium]|nr:fused MFS/spermidine synthase [Anaerolineales bacterium]